MNTSKKTSVGKIPILVLVGPTASGKSDLAVELALALNGEVISADSRQVYVGLDIGTGKITNEEMRGVPHHLLDIADPRERFTALDWKKLAEKAIADIHARGKLPIICGGTGFYISTLIDDLGFPDVPADTAEQARLEKQTPEALLTELATIDPKRAASIDPKNKRRLARAIVIARALGSVPAVTCPADDEQKYDITMIGLSLPDGELKERIHRRLLQRLDAGMIRECERLHAPAPAGTASSESKNLAPISLSYERMDELGLEYKYVSQYLQNKVTLAELTDILTAKIWQYARRQKTWFKKDARIAWFHPREKEAILKASEKLAQK